MRYFDFSPLTRSTVGFDRIFDLLDNASTLAQGDDGYPPYNIARTGESSYRIEIALAGFSPEDLTVTSQQNMLIVTGRRVGEDNAQYLHHGIAKRAFERRFNLADYVKVANASLVNGLLTIDLAREIPDEMKPRKIEVVSTAPKTIEQDKAA
jgi:molecular chaperone IbpA